MMGPVALGEGSNEMGGAPSPYVGAGVIAAGLVVLVVGVIYLNRDQTPTRLAMPTADGVTLPVDRDGRPVDVPPSQPATAVAFGAGGEILRPDPVRARIIDEDSGLEILITLPPNTTIDTVTGTLVPRRTTGTTGTPGTPGTDPTTGPTDPGTTATTSRPTTTDPPTTEPPTTEPPTTEPPTTEPPTTEPPTTEPPPDPTVVP
jgi:hypothetical protein